MKTTTSRSIEPLDVLVSNHQPDSASLRSYLIGFISSLFITLSAYFLARNHLLTKPYMIILLAVLALSQFMIQLIYFLHVGQEFSPRLKLIVMSFMIMIVIILVGGSIWIMHNLNGRVMTTKQMEQYMTDENVL